MLIGQYIIGNKNKPSHLIHNSLWDKYVNKLTNVWRDKTSYGAASVLKINLIV